MPAKTAALAALLLLSPQGPGLRETLLEAHNAERARIGTPPLAWSDTLAADARAYAREMARSGRFAHAIQPKGKPSQGENLWMGTRDAYALDEMVAGWIAEKRWFVNRPTPDFSATGKWADVAHYTQMIWAGTTQFGCAVASNREYDYLVCRYSPPGNVAGRRAIPAG
jgi:hypothetical protein